MNTLHVPLSRARKAWLGLPVLAAAGLLFGAPAQSAEPTASTGLYDAGTTPKVVDDGDTQSVELGVRFKASEAGVVQGVRYYKGATNTGTHTGSLWSETGQRIATATFTKESNTGWQTVTFANPVPIKAGTNYVASYYAPNGHYAQEQHTFADGKTLTNGPLTATKGLYTYGRSSFPTSSWRDSSYYVEPVFKAGTGHGVDSPHDLAVDELSTATSTLDDGDHDSPSSDVHEHGSHRRPRARLPPRRSRPPPRQARPPPRRRPRRRRRQRPSRLFDGVPERVEHRPERVAGHGQRFADHVDFGPGRQGQADHR